jgi:hypothetical protein
VTYVPGDKSELKSGAKIFIAGAAKKEDGMLEIASVYPGVGQILLVPMQHGTRLSGIELRALRRLQREQEAGRYVFMSERGHRSARQASGA